MRVHILSGKWRTEEPKLRRTLNAICNSVHLVARRTPCGDAPRTVDEAEQPRSVVNFDFLAGHSHLPESKVELTPSRSSAVSHITQSIKFMCELPDNELYIIYTEAASRFEAGPMQFIS